MRGGTAALALLIAAAPYAVAQSPETFGTRLAPVAIDSVMKPNTTGAGSVTAALSGGKLTVDGSFEGLRGPATEAHIRQGTAAGVRGPVILSLTVTKGVSGRISGAFDLTPQQAVRLRQGAWYIQINSEKAPEGNLWGWLWKKAGTER
jgi:hypothetical protein